MNRLLAAFRVRAATRTLQGTTFCEQCSEVCPPNCRREALIDQYRMNAQRAGLLHL